MIQIIADNIISGLGRDTAENLKALREGRSGIVKSRLFRVPDGKEVMVSLMGLPVEDVPQEMTRLEKFMVECVSKAAHRLDRGLEILKDRSTIFVFSTTKGNVACLGKDDAKSFLWHSSEAVAGYFSNPNVPITVSNACISGVSAILVAKRLLECGLYRTAVVVGADEVTEFTVSGFGSLMALSDQPCRPFDIRRHGLNVGEAVGTIILRRADSEEEILRSASYLKTPQFVTGGAVANDAYHVSSPSRTGEGLYRAIMRTLSVPAGSKAGLACTDVFVCPHGTATLYNDQMESVAFSRSGLGNLPMVPLKGYFGHTLGASGVIETGLSCHFMDEGWLPGCMGYSEPGCYPAPDVSSDARSTNARMFIKTISGFGGGNAVIKVEKLSEGIFKSNGNLAEIDVIDSFSMYHEGDVKEFLASVYRDGNYSYPKFHKMDLLCKGGFIAAEKLLDEVCDDDSTALVFVNSCASVSVDKEYQQTIAENNFFPSPSLFVYTLPNIVIGEISIRHKLYGEGAFFVQRDSSEGSGMKLAADYVRCLLSEGAAARALVCRAECLKDKCIIEAVLLGPKAN